MALGMAWGRNHGEAMDDGMFPVAADLHDYIKAEYKSTCCRVIVRNFEFASPERKKHCVTITGRVARWVADQLIEGGQVDPGQLASLQMSGAIQGADQTTDQVEDK